MSDLIDRQAAIDCMMRLQREDEEAYGASIPEGFDGDRAAEALMQLPSVQPEIIRCKDCRWWDKYDDWDNGYCMAAKHGYWSEHWEIIIRRTYKGDFYCADAEPKGEFEDEAEEEDEGDRNE